MAAPSPPVGASPIKDVLLIVGPPAAPREIAASSQVLGQHSPVFAAMFGPNFSEGQQLRDPKRTGPVQVPLPEDDADLMQLICSELHGDGSFEVTDLPEYEEALTVHAFALHLDKYGLLHTTRALVNKYLESVAPRWSDPVASVSSTHWITLFEAIQLLGSVKYFALSTHRFVQWCHKKYWPILPYDYSSLDDSSKRFYDACDSAASKAHEGLIRMVDSIADTLVYRLREYDSYRITNVKVCQANNDPPGYCDDVERCPATDKMITLCLKQFIARDLWPAQRRPRNRYFGNMEYAIESLGRFNVEVEACDGEECRAVKALKFFEEGLAKLKEKTDSDFTGVCLRCFNSGNKSGKACRAYHQK